MNFWIFSDQIILVVSGKAFLGTFESLSKWWSNQILPFLGIVLLRSFIKQVYNYLFVAVEKQNVLLPINLVGVLIGIPLWIWMIPKYGLFGGAVTQLTIELLFMLGAIRVGHRKKVQPIFSLRKWFLLLLILILGTWIGYSIVTIRHINILRFLIVAIVLNLLIIYVSLPTIKKVAKGLTVEDAVEPIIY